MKYHVYRLRLTGHDRDGNVTVVHVETGASINVVAGDTGASVVKKLQAAGVLSTTYTTRTVDVETDGQGFITVRAKRGATPLLNLFSRSSVERPGSVESPRRTSASCRERLPELESEEQILGAQLHDARQARKKACASTTAEALRDAKKAYDRAHKALPRNAHGKRLGAVQLARSYKAEVSAIASACRRQSQRTVRAQKLFTDARKNRLACTYRAESDSAAKRRDANVKNRQLSRYRLEESMDEALSAIPVEFESLRDTFFKRFVVSDLFRDLVKKKTLAGDVARPHEVLAEWIEENRRDLEVEASEQAELDANALILQALDEERTAHELEEEADRTDESDLGGDAYVEGVPF